MSWTWVRVENNNEFVLYAQYRHMVRKSEITKDRLHNTQSTHGTQISHY